MPSSSVSLRSCHASHRSDVLNGPFLMARTAVIGTVLLAAIGAVHVSPTRVTIDTGAIEGMVDSASGVVVFRGIPYAAPPVGDLRWRPPQPAKHWTGVRPASQLGHNCVQHQPYDDIDPFTAGVSEDCLYSTSLQALSLPLPACPLRTRLDPGAVLAGSELKRQNGHPREKGVVVVTPTIGSTVGLSRIGARCRITATCRGQLRAPRPDRRVAVGAAQHRALRWRSVARNNLRGIRGWIQRRLAHRFTIGERTLSTRDSGEWYRSRPRHRYARHRASCRASVR